MGARLVRAALGGRVPAGLGPGEGGLLMLVTALADDATRLVVLDEDQADLATRCPVADMRRALAWLEAQGLVPEGLG